MIPLLSMPYVVRVLGADSFGSLVFVTAIMGYLLLVADYGFNLTATRDISTAVGNSLAISSIYSSVISIKILILLLEFVLLSFALTVFELEGAFLYICSFMYMATQAVFPTFFFQGVGNMKWLTILSAAGKLAAVIFIFVLVDSPADVAMIPLINTIFGLFSLVAALLIVRKRYQVRFRYPAASELVAQLKLGWDVFSLNIFGGLYAGSGVIILGLVTNNAAVANYSLAEKLLQVIKGLYLPLVQALFPWFSRFISPRKKTIEVQLVKKLSLCLLVLLMSVVIIGVASDYIVPVLFGEDYYFVTEIFVILLFIPVIDFLRNISGILILVNLGEEKLNRKVTQFGVLVGIPVIYVLIVFYGGEGAAIGLALTEFSIAMCLTYFAFRIIRVER